MSLGLTIALSVMCAMEETEMFRDGTFLYADEYEAYMKFISTASRETWGTMTFSEWKEHRPNTQMHWDKWVEMYRPQGGK